MRNLDIVRIQGDKRETREDLVTEEISLRLLAGDRRIAVLICSPGNLEDLVHGFFYSNGFIQSADQIRRIVINRATWSAFIETAPEIDPGSFVLSGVIGSACGSTLPGEDGAELEEENRPQDEVRPQGEAEPEYGVPRIKDPAGPDSSRLAALRLRVAPGYISDLMQEFRGRSELHRQTGGVHAAALADQEGLLVFREDIGRHNAVDKVIGAHLLQCNSFEDRILLTSGRLSSEILHKAAACCLPLVVSRSAPTDHCVTLARERNITLIGFARGRRMNIYSGAERVAVGFDDP